MLAYGLALLDVVALVTWAGAEVAGSRQTAFLFGTPSYYALVAVLMTLAGIGFTVLAHLGRDGWRRPSARCLWVSSLLLLVPLAISFIIELVLLTGALVGGF